jgi:acyl-CoA thioesterase YciA
MTNDNPRGELTVRISAMPADTNANGDIFGGWVLSRMDQAGGIAGVERAKGRVVTIAVEAMTSFDLSGSATCLKSTPRSKASAAAR